ARFAPGAASKRLGRRRGVAGAARDDRVLAPAHPRRRSHLHRRSRYLSDHRSFALPGARPQYGPDKVVDVLHIDLRLRPDVEATALDAGGTTTVRAIEDGVARLALDAVDLEIASVVRTDDRRVLEHRATS